MKPAWKSCKPLREALGKESFMKVYQILTIFADPSKYDIYHVAKNGLANWSDVKAKGEKALGELSRGNCARCGYIFGKILRQIVDLDESLASLAWDQVESLLNDLGGAVGRGLNDVVAGVAGASGQG